MNMSSLCHPFLFFLSSLMIGFMGTTAFLSMWISNTASTAMMLPIAQAVLQQLNDTEAKADRREKKLAEEGQDNQAFEMSDIKEANGSTIQIGVFMCVCTRVSLFSLIS